MPSYVWVVLDRRSAFECGQIVGPWDCALCRPTPFSYARRALRGAVGRARTSMTRTKRLQRL
eukprot:CAMPEP_0184253416 /NCGR_PEP_ID=MMETSP0977-20130417/6683_1 /TAXON_ID=483370 /ORGANISM="non described non described, Strain CCMP2097" /LENGTH=61 /DNA_ID=CAMNT_0026558927 /DNA_START=21 /DNA_END=203 /DNA_ORIENTATION=+